MAYVDDLARAFESFVALPWPPGLSGAERVWFAVYPPRDERRLRARLRAFEAASVGSGHPFCAADLTPLFARWLAGQKYRDRFFQNPALMDMPLNSLFPKFVVDELAPALDACLPDGVLALTGAASLFGLMRVSALVEQLAPRVRGRLLVFFPGTVEGHANPNLATRNYRLLDARDGWNYLAVPIQP